MDSRITSAIRFLAMDGPSEAPDALRNCKSKGTHAGNFWEKDPEPSDSQRVPLCKKGLKTLFPGLFLPSKMLLKLKDSQLHINI